MPPCAASIMTRHHGLPGAERQRGAWWPVVPALHADLPCCADAYLTGAKESAAGALFI
jgi:hypothetical protein